METSTPSRRSSGAARETRSLEARYLGLLEAFVRVARQAGLEIAPYGRGPLHFRALRADAQSRIISHFSTYVAVCQEIQSQSADLLDEKTFFWRMLVKLRLKPSSSLMDRIDNDHIVEIYDAIDYVQVFRSMNFYRVCSYSLDDVLCRPWFELYKREEAVTQHILATCAKVLEPSGPETLDYDLPMHVLKEIDSTKCFAWLIEICFCGRLSDERGKLNHFVNVNRAVELLT